MNESSHKGNSATDEQLIAYLDGELNTEAARQLDQRLANEPQLQQRLQQHQRAWDMLDELPHTDVGERFTHTTVEMVAVSIADHVDETSQTTARRSKLVWLAGGMLSIAASIVGYFVVASALSNPNRQLVEDLRVIENLDAYRAAEDIEFLRALESEGLFTGELDTSELDAGELNDEL